MPDISATLVSKSDQLDNVDLMGGARVFTIAGVTINVDAEQPLSIRLEEYPRPWKPGVTMRRLLAELWGAESDDWIGHKVRLYRDDTVTFGKVKPGGTRVSHASHINKKLEVTLPTSKGKFAEFRVEPLPDAPSAPDDTASRASKAVEWFAATHNVSQANLEAHVGKPIAAWSLADIDALKANPGAVVGSES